MAIGIALIVLVIGAVAFHFWSPWTYTQLASNWGQIDFTLDITLVLTGIVFIIINLFVAYCTIRYRYNKNNKADFDPENKKMEWILIAITSLGVIFLLAPGLFVYSEFVSPPEDAQIVEVVGQQFAWSFRFPGEDDVLGISDMRFVSLTNPYGIDPDDPNGHDDILIQDKVLHLPVGVPVKTQMRSKDVLHDFYVPNFRVKMDLVPGLVTSLWFTPTEVGDYEIVCAEYCGNGHHTMGGRVIVEDQASFDAWLEQFPVFKPEGPVVELTIEQMGENLARSACLTCHSIDGTPAVGPTWAGLYGKQETLSDGSTVPVDDEYLRESIVNPNAKIVQGFAGGMPAFANLSDEEIDALIAYIQTLSN